MRIYSEAFPAAQSSGTLMKSILRLAALSFLLLSGSAPGASSDELAVRKVVVEGNEGWLVASRTLDALPLRQWFRDQALVDFSKDIATKKRNSSLFSSIHLRSRSRASRSTSTNVKPAYRPQRSGRRPGMTSARVSASLATDPTSPGSPTSSNTTGNGGRSPVPRANRWAIEHPCDPATRRPLNLSKSAAGSCLEGASLFPRRRKTPRVA